ncbi:MAG: TolB family protein [Candidatus Limnocylindria bacterium]
MFSRFDESTHTFLGTHLIRPDGTGEIELTLPGPEGGGRWSRDGSRIAVMTILADERVGTAILTPDGTVERVLDIPDPTLNLVCTVWSPDDERLACEGFNDADPAQNGVYTIRASDGGDLKRLSTAPEGMVDLPGDYSPDGRQFIFKRSAGEADGPLVLVDAGGGEPPPLSEQTYEDAGRFSPAGDSVLTSRADGSCCLTMTATR